MKHWQFEATVTLKGRMFVASFECDADTLRDGFEKARRYFSKNYEIYEIFGFNLLWENEQ